MAAPRTWLIALALTLTRCSGCLPPLLDDASAITELPPPEVGAEPSTPSGPEGPTNQEPPACAAVGSCCENADCVGNPLGPTCINDKCGIEPCMGEGTSCGNGGRCCSAVCQQNATCCETSECLSGQVCADGQCGACDATHACETGSVCCGGTCVDGTCCDSDGCQNTQQACIDNACTACTLGGSDCRDGQGCCDDPTLGAICIGDTGCCPNVLDNSACDGASDPTARACSIITRTCGACDSVNAPCAAGRVCCGGACIDAGASGPLGAACCASPDCASTFCAIDTHTCVECAGPGTCGNEVCDNGVCVACDGAHACDGGQLCCGGTCLSGSCCGDGDCPGTAPVCDTSTHTCRGCTIDSECAAGSVCVDPSGEGACTGSGCSCQIGACHFTHTIAPADCAGACCNYACTAGGTCCDNSDCSAANPGFDPANICTSAQTAAPIQICDGTQHCACPQPTGGVAYVDANLGNDTTGTGSAACPFKTVSRGLVLGASWTINLRPGRYNAGEAFPLVLPAGTLLQRDPSCSSGTAIIARTDAAATCPVSGATSCAIAVTAASVAIMDVTIKNTGGAAVAFGDGANATSGIYSGVIGCEGPIAGCDRGGAEGQATHELIYIGGNAAPTIGGAATGALIFSGSTSSALIIANTAAPLVRNLDRFVSFDGDIFSVRDAATPTFSNIAINWPSGALDTNLARCFAVSGAGAGFTLSQTWMRGCGTGGIYVTRTHSGAPYAFNDVRVDAAQGTPHLSGNVNRSEGFGLWLQGGAVVAMGGGRLSNNRGHGAMVRAASLTMSGVLVEDNGQQAPVPTACYGGNGLEINDNAAVVIATGSTFSGSRGRTSPPPGTGLEACATGDGVRLGRGSASFSGSTFTGNAFDGLLVETNAASASATGSTFAGNAANGVEVQTINANISGNNRFAACPLEGNGRANVCYVTPLIPGTMRAQNNAWLQNPPDVVGDDNPQPEIPGDPEDIIRYSASLAHCGGTGTHDITIISSQFAFPPFIPISAVTRSPTLAPVFCP